MKPCQGIVDLFGSNEGESSKLTEEARKDMGITKTLPRNLPDALKLLNNDNALKYVLGDKFVESYIAVKQVWPLLIVIDKSLRWTSLMTSLKMNKKSG
jgi:hypothetical protein